MSLRLPDNYEALSGDEKLSAFQRAVVQKVEGFHRIEQVLGMEDSDPEAVVAEVRRVFEALPVTRDGVRVLPGMEIWHPEYHEVLIPDYDNNGRAVAHRPGYRWYQHGSFDIGECYSKQESAAAAKGGG